MPFANQVLSDDDIERYGLPFSKGSSCHWTRDAERDYFLWGGLIGNPAFDDWQEGDFVLYVDGIEYHVMLEPGLNGLDSSSGTYVVHWSRILSINPEPDIGDSDHILEILAEALVAYGVNGSAAITSNVRVEVVF